MAEGGQRHFRCVKPDCSHLSFPSFKRYLSHLRNYHVLEPNFGIMCPVNSCFRSYSLISSLSSHMRRKHREVDFGNDLNELPPQVDDCQNAFEDSSPLRCNGEEVDCGSHAISVKEMELFALKTQEFNRLSDIATDTILESTYQLLEQNEEHLKVQVKKCIEETGLNVKDIEGLEELLESQQDVAISMKQLKTSKERNKYLRDTLNMVEANEIVLEEEVINSGNTGPFRVKKHSFQYISVIKVLEQLLNQVDIFSQVQNTHRSTDGKMRDFCDGELFSAGGHPLFSVNHKAIQLLLYYDDFEVANPLGAKATLHKLGGFYWVLGNIHPKYQSSLKMLNLAILCPVKWIKKYGMGRVLKPLMADVALLESEHGVQLKIGPCVRSIEGTLSLVLADNLGSNGIGGFMESFSARRPCRFCMGILDEFQAKFTEEEFNMRAREMYDRHAELVATDPESIPFYGVKQRSALNSSKYFHVVDGLPSDIMHDILEGVLPLHLKVMLRKFVSDEKRFTLDELNIRIHGFAFGANDFRNKPSLLKNLNASNHPIRQSASQMWCLSRLLPLVIHDLVPKGNSDWELFTDLMKIVDIIISPVIARGTTFYLQILIKEYLQEFRNLYPNTRVIPKQHFMVHYPTQIRRNGPLVRQWCMRFEAKHHYFKRLAQGMNNFKNLSKTLAIRHQRLQCYWLSEEDAYLKPVSETGPGSTVELKEIAAETFSSLCNKCASLTPETKVYMGNWIVIHGVKYHKGAAVVYQHSILPVFLMIEDIFIMSNGDVYFCCRKMRTLILHKHLHSYEVALVNTIAIIHFDELLDYHPLDVYAVKTDGIMRKLIRMRYDLGDCEN